MVTGGRLPSLSDRPQGSYEEVRTLVPSQSPGLTPRANQSAPITHAVMFHASQIIMKVPARQLPSIASSYLLYSLLPSDVLIPTRLLSALISNCPRFR